MVNLRQSNFSPKSRTPWTEASPRCSVNPGRQRSPEIHEANSRGFADVMQKKCQKNQQFGNGLCHLLMVVWRWFAIVLSTFYRTPPAI